MSYSHVYVSIGSNSGDRRAFIGRAVAALAMRLAAKSIITSSPYTSEPWGFSSPDSFLNIAAAIRFSHDEEWTEKSAEALLDTIQDIERSISTMPHRNADGTYRNREIDIDIIAIDRLSINTERLTIPHPLAGRRDFVMTPLAELDNDICKFIYRIQNISETEK